MDTSENVQLPFRAIKYWAKDDRPREKMLKKGVSSLSDAELIAILIGSGSREESAVDLSKKILAYCGNSLAELGKCSVKDLMKFRGIGEAKALAIAAATELGRRRSESDGLKKPRIVSSGDVYDIFHDHLGDLPHEEFWVLLLNRANKVLGKYSISKGGLSGTVADSKVIFKLAIDHRASSLILCHNHPSGNRQPSESDMQLTKKLREAGKVLDIAVLDHLIIADGEYYSFADEGML